MSACSDPSLLQANQASLVVRDWLETQSRVTDYWRDLLLSSGGDEALIAALDAHAMFLRAAAHIGEGEIKPSTSLSPRSGRSA
ncbi:hypothetical protein [Maricaulis sp.]|uniref:hypothetical protein n=1 Tax=Maricaulis sp. TaxID=1486257 RepID=UPI0025C28F5F|nr:hypothetical protein [Maricaulis sp.]